jgi:competence protein ComEC
VSRWLSAGLVGVLAVGAGFLAGHSSGDPTSLVFVSVGQGDGAIFHTAGHTILIDDGPVTPTTDAGEREMIPELRRLGIGSVDAILLSHPDSDHVGGTGSLLRAFPNAKVMMSAEFESNPEMEKHFGQWHYDPAQVVWLPETCQFQMGSFQVHIDCPPLPVHGDTNSGSMFVHLADGGATATFSGDAPKDVEKFEETQFDWSAELIKLGHHGSRTASDPSWLEKVHPLIAIVSVGRNNRYGHPNHEVLDLLQADHIQTLRTDEDGTLEFREEGGKFVLENRAR